jgi:hypothetical protein
LATAIFGLEWVTVATSNDGKGGKMANQPLIRNYGLFWKSEDVYWGAGSQAGALYGVEAKNITGPHVDFRDQRGVYVLYADYDLVYVGQNNGQELLKRLIQHKRDDLADRWNRFSWFGLRSVKTKSELANFNQDVHARSHVVLDHIEAILIHAAEPRMNRQGGRFGNDIKRFLQVRDDRLGPSDREILEKLHKASKQ